MKQHITKEQVEESGLCLKLREILKDEYYGGDNYLHEKISMGKMIEILENNIPVKGCELRMGKTWYSMYSIYRWQVWYTVCEGYEGSKTYIEGELADALWEAVKEALNVEIVSFFEKE